MKRHKMMLSSMAMAAHHGPSERVLGEAQGEAGHAAQHLADEQPPHAAADAPAAAAQVGDVAACECMQQPESQQCGLRL